MLPWPKPTPTGHRAGKRLALWPAVLGLVGAVTLSPPAYGDQTAVEIEQRSELHEIRYCLESTECRLCWTVMDTELNRGIVANQDRCARPLAEQVPDLTRILEAVLIHNPAVSFHTLFWGGLCQDALQDDMIIARRLCLAAFHSPGWDRRKGRPVDGEINAWVRDLANSAAIYPEVQQIFRAHAKTVAVSGIEKVLVLPAAKLPFFEELRKEGVAAGDKLPFDALVWFRISNR